MTPRLIDRSRILARRECPRRRWFGYEIYGRGVALKRKYLPLLDGISVHTALAMLLEGQDVNAAIHKALTDYGAAVDRYGLVLAEGEDTPYVIAEQAALIEALIRTYAVVGLPRLLDEFDVIEVEKEHKVELSGETVLMTRADALLQERATDDYHILSYKTAATWDRRKKREAQHDDQGLSELLGVESSLENGEQVMGIRMEYLLKGERTDYPAQDGHYIQHSPLIRAYRRQGITPDQDELTARYEWKCVGPHTAYGARKTWECPGGKTHKLGADWEKVNAWELAGGIERWIEWLAHHDLELLQKQIVVPNPYSRREEDLKHWIRQVTHAEDQLGTYVEFTERARDRGDRALYLNQLDLFFEQNRRSCDWPSTCPFQEICFGATDPMDPLSDPAFEPRTPHHQPELIQIEGAEL